MKAFWAPFKQ